MLAVVASVLPAQQTGTVTGRVVDAEDAKPIAGARITVLTSGQVQAAAPALSGADGRYSIPLTAGTYQLYVTAIGFTARRVQNVTVTAGQTTTVDVSMTPFKTSLQQIAVTSTRGQPEKVLDAPAQVISVTNEEIAARPAVTVAENLRNVPGVDISTGGIVQSNIVSRGFNNAFSGAMLMLQDYRFAGVPSLRVNVPFLFTGTNEDIERVEVLNGPASALYGPNSGNGAMHIITKSPFNSQGTTISVDGGSQSIIRAGLRTAHTIGDKVGVKLSGEYMQGQDFRFTDLAEPTTFAAAAPPGRAGQPNVRNFDVGRYTGEARLDWRPRGEKGDLELITTYGFTNVNNGMELTGANGTSQIKGWTYQNIQQRVRWGRFFAQAFLNSSDAGNDNGQSITNTFLLRSGQPIVDKSQVFSAQVQHGLTAGKLDLTYGADYIATRPNTAGTINGRNENNADVTEIGGYVQGKYKLTNTLELLGAIRVDDHSQLEGTFFSPRAALLWKPNANETWRLTYNRAFNTPANFAFFLDLINARNLGGSGYDLRALGNANGWQFDRSCGTGSVFGAFCMRSPFVPGGTPGTFLQTGANAATAWNGLVTAQRTALIGGPAAGLQGAFNQAIQTALTQAGLGALIPTIVGAVATATATAATGGIDALRSGAPSTANIPTRVAFINHATANIQPAVLADLARLRATYNETFEIGWKGAIGQRFSMDFAGWTQLRRDVGTPAGLATPSVFMDAGSPANQAAIGGYMGARLQTGVVGSGYTTALAGAHGAAGVPTTVIPTLVNGIVSGAINGFVPAALGNLARAPLGTITFNDATFGQSPDLLATYQTIEGRLWVYGADASMQYLLDNQWTLSGTIGGVNRTQFGEFLDSNGLPLATNSPGLRGQLTVRYQQEPGKGWGGEVRGRYTDAFQVNSGVYNTGYCNAIAPGNPGAIANATPGPITRFGGTCPAGTFAYNSQFGGVPVNMMLDLGLTYRFQLGGKDALWSLTATNLFDNQVPTFAGVPNIGRLVMTRLSYTF
ncbi:MAG: TonB-dependent receptor domain-containing protein [Gemmatimonadota bacterium]